MHAMVSGYFPHAHAYLQQYTLLYTSRALAHAIFLGDAGIWTEDEMGTIRGRKQIQIVDIQNELDLLAFLCNVPETVPENINKANTNPDFRRLFVVARPIENSATLTMLLQTAEYCNADVAMMEPRCEIKDALLVRKVNVDCLRGLIDATAPHGLPLTTHS